MTVKESGLGSGSYFDEDVYEDVDEDVDDIQLTFEAIKKKFVENEINLRDAAELKKFADDYKDYLGETTSEAHYKNTLLHLLVDEARQNFDKYEPLIKLIIENHPDILKKGDTTGRTSLYNAVSRKSYKLVRLICNMHPDINSVLEQACVDSKETCIHAAIHKSVGPKLAIFLVNKASEKVLCLQDSHGNTPLHSAVEYKCCTEDQLQIVQALAERGGGAMNRRTNDACASPYLYHMHTRAEAEEKAAKDAADKTKESTQGKKLNSNVASWDGVIGKSGEGADFKTTFGGESKASIPSVASSGQRKHISGETLDKNSLIRRPSLMSQMASAKHGSSTLPYGGVKGAEIAQGLGERPKDSMDEDPKMLDRQDGTLTKPEKRNTRKPDASKVRVTDASAEAVKEFLMLHCMRTMSTKDAEDFLYGNTQGKEICFNLCDQRPLEITEDQINKGYSPLEFETVLQYVALPNFQIEKRSVRPRGKRPVKPDGNGRDDMVVLFQFLRKKNVKRIIRVMVDDRDKIPHSDGAIDIALRGLKVEIWDWQKFDVCTETIASAAPDVEQVHLYWSGNNAVLRGWSDKEVLKLMKSLKKVYLHTTQGLETAERTKENVTEFTNRMKLHGVHVEPPINETPPQNHESSNTPTKIEEGQLARRRQWLICMDDFADFIQSLKSTSASYEPIKIALIDDGVDMRENSLYDKLLRGKSFRLRDENQYLNHSYYVKGGGHGTAMASLICRVCPNAKIIPLKLDEGDEKSKRQITAESAAKAVEYAIQRGADIISMSWTIERTVDNESHIGNLEKAVQAAAKKPILMFCAASDGGAISDKSFPAESLRDLVFKIGAATEEGKAWKWVGDEKNIDFIFPGHDVVQERYPEALLQSCNLLTGSSVATAIAAGLAALVLDCVQLAALHYQELLDQQKELTSPQPPQRGGSATMQNSRDPGEESRLQQRKRDVDQALQRSKQVWRRDYDNLKAPKKMKEAFGKIGLTGKKYVKVWDTFQNAPKDAVGKTKEEKMENILCSIASKLKGEDT